MVLESERQAQCVHLSPLPSARVAPHSGCSGVVLSLAIYLRDCNLLCPAELILSLCVLKQGLKWVVASPDLNALAAGWPRAGRASNTRKVEEPWPLAAIRHKPWCC